MDSEPEIPKGKPQIDLVEYTPIIQRDPSGKREVELRFRLVKRRAPSGKLETVLDIREYILDEARASFTRKGMVFLEHELEQVIKNLTQAKADLDQTYGTNSRDRITNPRHN